MSGAATEVRSRANSRSMDSAADPVTDGAVVGSARFESQNPFGVLARKKKERKMSLAISGGKGAPGAKKKTAKE